jgi:hypothetical protein
MLTKALNINTDDKNALGLKISLNQLLFWNHGLAGDTTR